MTMISISTENELYILDVEGNDVKCICGELSENLIALLTTIVNTDKPHDPEESLHPDIIEALRFTDEDENTVSQRQPEAEELLKTSDLHQAANADKDMQRLLNVMRDNGERTIDEGSDVTVIIHGDWYLARVETPQPRVENYRLIHSTIWLICRDDKIRKPPRTFPYVIEGPNALLERGVNLIRHCNTVY